MAESEPAVPPRHRHRAHAARGVRHRATGAGGRDRTEADRGGEAAYTFEKGAADRAQSRHRDAVLRDARRLWPAATGGCSAPGRCALRGSLQARRSRLAHRPMIRNRRSSHDWTQDSRMSRQGTWVEVEEMKPPMLRLPATRCCHSTPRRPRVHHASSQPGGLLDRVLCTLVRRRRTFRKQHAQPAEQVLQDHGPGRRPGAGQRTTGTTRVALLRLRTVPAEGPAAFTTTSWVLKRTGWMVPARHLASTRSSSTSGTTASAPARWPTTT